MTGSSGHRGERNAEPHVRCAPQSLSPELCRHVSGHEVQPLWQGAQAEAFETSDLAVQPLAIVLQGLGQVERGLEQIRVLADRAFLDSHLSEPGFGQDADAVAGVHHNRVPSLQVADIGQHRFASLSGAAQHELGHVWEPFFLEDPKSSVCRLHAERSTHALEQAVVQGSQEASHHGAAGSPQETSEFAIDIGRGLDDDREVELQIGTDDRFQKILGPGERFVEQRVDEEVSLAVELVFSGIPAEVGHNGLGRPGSPGRAERLLESQKRQSCGQPVLVMTQQLVWDFL